MKLKITQSIFDVFNERVLNVGEIIDEKNKERAEQLIAANYAEEVVEEKKPMAKAPAKPKQKVQPKDGDK